MKNLKLIITALIFLTSLIKAQDRVTPISIFGNMNQALIDRTIDRTNDEFILGWNWGNLGLKLDEALGMNYTHVGFTHVWNHDKNSAYFNSASNIPNQKRSVQISSVLIGRNSPLKTNTISIHLEPTIEIDSLNMNDFKKRPGENTDAFFGFQQKFLGSNTVIDTTDQTNALYQSYNLYKVDIGTISTNDNLVLWDIFSKDQLRSLTYHCESYDDQFFDSKGDLQTRAHTYDMSTSSQNNRFYYEERDDDVNGEELYLRKNIFTVYY